MKTQNKVRFIALLLTPLMVVVMIVAPATSMAAPLPVNLGTAASFALLAGTAITCTNQATINGDVGISPGIAWTPGTPPATVNGTVYLHPSAVAVQAKADLQAAFTDAAGRAPALVDTELGGTTLTSGVYNSASGTFGITGNLTLDGQNDPNAVFIFQTATTLITASSSKVILINGAKSSQIYWKVGSSATLGTYSYFAGNILAQTAITATTVAAVNGRLLALDAAVTTDGNTATSPSFGATYGVSVVHATGATSARPGTAVTYNLTVTNTGNVPDVFNATVTGNAWPTPVPAPVGPLAAGASSVVAVTVNVPAGAVIGATDTANVTFTSVGDPTKSASSTLTTTASNAVHGVSVAPATKAKFGKQGTAVTYSLTVTNIGSGIDTFNATVAGNTWPTPVPASVGPLAAGASSAVTVTTNIPGGAHEMAIDIANVTFISAGDSSKSATSVLTTTASKTWVSGFYFAEGTTRANFQEYLCLGNSGDHAANAKVTYMFTDATTKDANYIVPANSRYTVNVNSEVGAGKDLSLRILADSTDVVAERPMYFNYNGVWTGGSDAIGAVAPNKKWYFAEGNTLKEFDQYVTVLNPGSTKANLTFRYMVEGEGEKDVTGSVGAHSRATFKTRDQIGDGKNVSLSLESNQLVVAERPMYFNYLGLAANNWTGGHDVVGTNAPNTNWYFAEGTTRKNSVDGAFEQWLCLQNPGTKPITVTATYQLATGQGDPVSKSYTVPAQERLTVSVNKEIGADKDDSVFLTSTSLFIAERPMYFSYHASAWTGGHDVLGVNSTATTWFFAEGTTRNNFEEWLCLQNPGNSDAKTTITYYTTSGQVITKSWTVKANTRLTVSANTDVGANQDISAKVSSDKPIIVERPMYFNFNGVWNGGHDVVGFVPTQ